MLKRYQVDYHVPCRYSRNHETVWSKRFVSRSSAYKAAERMNARHCHETRYRLHSRRPEVLLRDLKAGEYITLDPILVPSVGELGYW